MTNKEAAKYLQQLYPNGWHCWLDKQRIEAIGMAIKTFQVEPVIEELEEAAKEQARSYGYNPEDYEFKENVESFKKGDRWDRQRTIEKAVKWLTANLANYFGHEGAYTYIDDFRKALEE